MAYFQKNFTLFIFFSLLIQINPSYIFFPFVKQNKTQLEKNLTLDNFVKYYIEPKFSSQIEVGSPPQKVELLYSSQNYGISMVEDPNYKYIDSFFNKKLSSSICITHVYDSKLAYGIKRPVTLNDSLYFPFYDSNLNLISKVELQNYSFVYLTREDSLDYYINDKFEKEKDGKAYMLYGSKVFCKTDTELCETIPYILRHNKIIESEIFNVIYNNKSQDKENFDFKIIIGNEPHKMYPDIYDEDDLMHVEALSYAKEVSWIVQFYEVFYFPINFELNMSDYSNDINQINFDDSLKGKKVYSYRDSGQMVFDLDVILCPKIFYISINKTYFGIYKDKCTIHNVKYRYYIFSCDKDFPTDNFPTIYFFHKDLNYTFFLTHNELFVIKGDRKYCLIVFDLFGTYFWMLGKTFLKKYSFNYDMPNKKIGFYRKTKSKQNTDDNDNKIKNKEEKNYYVLINLIWLSIVLSIGIATFFIIKQLFCYKNRKKRANELDDSFDYEITRENSEKGDENILYHSSNNKEEKLYNNKLVD